MIGYKSIVRLIANTEKNYFLSDKTENKCKKRIRKNLSNKVIKYTPIKNDNKWIMSLLFKMMITQLGGCDNKYKHKVYKELLTNFLIINSREETEKFKNMFYKIQRIYNILNRFIYNYKFKKTKVVVDSDMCLNELRENDKNVISIVQNNSKYLFNIKDLINIIETSLTSSHNFFVQPKKINNPYNNVAFNKSTLYNIYFFVRFNTNYYSELLFKFFNCDFNLTTFKQTHEYILREYVIKNFVYKSAANILVDEIKYMIDEFNDICSNAGVHYKIEIHDTFPNDRLIKIMQPYLFLFCKALYSYHPIDKKNFAYYFKQGLLRFYKFNPHFGKVKAELVYKMDENNITRIVCVKSFEDKHIPFNNIERQNNDFLSDHLDYENIIINTIIDTS
jgi:hypothetical protein